MSRSRDLLDQIYSSGAGERQIQHHLLQRLIIGEELSQTLTVNTQLLGQSTLGVGVKSLQRISRNGQQISVNKDLLEILIKKVTASDKKTEQLLGKIDV